jgi:SAM-dependent methyltransferase
MGPEKREYQADFYATCESVRDPAKRLRKAEKIVYALRRYARRPLSSAVCLDLGCSSGIIASAVASLCGNVLGLEYDRVALEATDPCDRSKVGFVRGDAMHLPLADDVVDIIICAQVYEHVPDAELMVREMNRVLAPDGLVFFSGPNWLFPIEPHYFLPFLHWLPGWLADRYLWLAGKGDHYYERLRHVWDLRKLVECFVIHDVTVEVMQDFYLSKSRVLRPAVGMVPKPVWKALLPFFPNYNWILHKPSA